MPLSEDEERILLEIEESLYESDPDLAREVSETTVYTKSFKNLKWSLLVFLLGVVCMLLTLSISFLVAFGAFLLMLFSALAIERNARNLGRTGIQQAAQSSMWAEKGIKLGDSSQKFRDLMKDRFRRDNQG